MSRFYKREITEYPIHQFFKFEMGLLTLQIQGCILRIDRRF